MTMTAPQIRKILDRWLAPSGPLPTPGGLNQLKIAWREIKPNMQESYHPIIEDRLAEVESRLSRQMTSEQALDVIKETLVFLTLRTSQVEEAMIVAGHGSNQSFASLVYDLNQARSDLRSKTK